MTEHEQKVQDVLAWAEGTRPAHTPSPMFGIAKPEAVENPAHYNAGKVECIDAIEAATVALAGGEAFNTGQVIKYIWRWKLKGGKEDLLKCRWHLDRLIQGLDSEDA